MKRMIILALCLLLAALPLLATAEEAVIPDLTVKQWDIPDTEGMAFLRKMGVGWVLGNTFDAHAQNFNGDEMGLETYWCGVKTTEDMIKAIHEAGYSTLRLPVSWHNHVDADFNISEAWLSRVEEVARWALNSGMYVILNTHHDEGYDWFYPDEAHFETSSRYLTAIWTQLSQRFADCDEHLIFENLNEPRLTKDKAHEWSLDENDAGCREAMDCINRLHQVFVDTVRAAGGCNVDRYLMISSYDASVDGAKSELFHLPKDTVEDRLIVSVHAYTPYSFALDTRGTKEYSVNVMANTAAVATFMNDLYHMYIEQGIPVVIGEFGAVNKDNLQARVEFTAYYTASAIARGMPVCWWDNNARRGNGENFAIFNRKGLSWYFPEIKDAMIRYSKRLDAE